MFRNPLTDVIVVLVVVLLIFGPKRLPQLGKSLGQGMREFKEGITGSSSDSEGEERQALPAGEAAEAPATSGSATSATATSGSASSAPEPDPAKVAASATSAPEPDPAKVAPSDRA